MVQSLFKTSASEENFFLNGKSQHSIDISEHGDIKSRGSHKENTMKAQKFWGL